MILDKFFEIHDGKSRIDKLLKWSLIKALKHQDIHNFYEIICELLPDISNQYTNPEGINCLDINSPYYSEVYYLKVRAQHAFQIYYTVKMLKKYCFSDKFDLVDIGDSSGNHIKYLKLLEEIYDYELNETYSVNIDPIAIDKINKNGGNAILSRAEDINKIGIKSDVIVCYETLEHLISPVEFLYILSKNPPNKFVLFTVPYLKTSRVGLHHIRMNLDNSYADPEDVHIYELSPEDWKLLALHCGWQVVNEMIYLQYPNHFVFKWLKPIWEKYEYLGFYGFTVIPNEKYKELYTGWID